MHRVEADLTGGTGLAEASSTRALLKRFAEHRDEAAFADLVRRYGPLVFSLCRRVLRHQQDAEDAFQATFLVLARKAGSIGRPECTGTWLYSVAYRIARRAKANRARLPVNEFSLPDVPMDEGVPEVVWRDLRPLLDEEVGRLPRLYREPFILCYFDGKTNEQAAALLGCPLGTVLSRLSRARDRLRTRLKRRGITLSAAALVAVLTSEAAASAMPPALVPETVQAAVQFAGGKPPTTQAAPGNGATHAEGFLKAFARARRVSLAAGLLAASMGLTAVALVLFLVKGGKPDQEQIQGTWLADRIEMGGVEMTAAGSKMVFDGDRWELTCKVMGPNDTFTAMAAFRLDPARSPKSIDFSPAPGTIWPGIYQLEKDTLKVCFNDGGPERPTDFASPPGSSLFRYELERSR